MVAVSVVDFLPRVLVCVVGCAVALALRWGLRRVMIEGVLMCRRLTLSRTRG